MSMNGMCLFHIVSTHSGVACRFGTEMCCMPIWQRRNVLHANMAKKKCVACRFGTEEMFCITIWLIRNGLHADLAQKKWNEHFQF